MRAIRAPRVERGGQEGAERATTAIEAEAECGITRPMFPVPSAAVPASVAASAEPGGPVSCRARA